MPMGVMACFWVMQGRCGASLSLVWRPWVFAALVTWTILKIPDATMGLRVSMEHEQMGLELSQHSWVHHVSVCGGRHALRVSRVWHREQR